MTDCQVDCEGPSPMELYEQLNAQGDKVRALKSAKAEKVSGCQLSQLQTLLSFCGFVITSMLHFY